MKWSKRISVLVFMVALGLAMAHYFMGTPRKRPPREGISPGDGAAGRVVKIVDGDTVKVRLDENAQLVTVRLRGIDCPESRHNNKCERDGKAGRRGCAWQVPRGKRATKMAEQILARRKVTLECGGKCSRGGYGRELRYLKLEDGRDYGLEMIRRGLCEDFSYRYPHKRSQAYLRVQASARKDQQGVWAK